MEQSVIDAIINYGEIILSDINFILAMLVIVLVAACFLGRYIVITRKMVIATLGILVIQIVFVLLINLIIWKINPELYEVLENLDTKSGLSTSDPYYEAVQIYSFGSSLILNGGIFLYAFIFYLLAYKEKRWIRAIESEVCLYLYYAYINNMIQYTYLYVRGVGDETLEAVAGVFFSSEYYIMITFTVIAQFVLSLALLLILYFGYFKKKRFYVISVNKRILFFGWLLVFSVFPAAPASYISLDQDYSVLSIMFGIMIPVLGGLAPILLVMNAAEKSLKEKNEYQESYLAAELEYIEQYKRTQTETRAFRHDIINNLSLTNMMLEEGNVDGASEHLKSLLGNVKALSPAIITGDEMLDCIVAMKADKMKEMHIEFSTDGVIDGGLNMKPMDVCSIFANALDNAIEAASKISLENNPWVSMRIKRTEKFFIIRIANASSVKVDVEKLFMSSGYTSKKDTEHHGFGLRNIQNAAEKYDGIIKAESDENEFALSIMIPRTK